MIVPFILLLLYNSLIPSCVSEEVLRDGEPNNNKGKCNITDTTSLEYQMFIQVKLNDNQTEEFVLQREYAEKLDIKRCIKSQDPDMTKYFTFSNTDKEIQLKAKKELVDLDKDLDPQTNIVFSGYISCYLACNEGETIIKFQLAITDVNEHPPTFEKNEYTFEVPSPLMPQSDISRYGSAIVVEDLDFSNKNVTFSIEPDDFEIKTIVDRKKYTALFFTRNVMFMNETREYTLTATDSGTIPGPLKTTKKIILKVDPNESIDNPTFSATSYSFEYKIEGEKPVLVPKDGVISVSSLKLDKAEIILTGTGDQIDKIGYHLDPNKKTIDLTLKAPITTTSSLLSLKLNVRTDITTSVLIVINMPELTLEFNQHFFTGKYDPATKQLSLDKDITLKSSGPATLQLSGDESSYLEVKKDEGKQSYSISLKDKNGIPEKDLEGKTSLSFTLTATLSTKTDRASILLSLPKKHFKFTRNLYTASYDAESKSITLDEKNPIAFTESVEGDVSITLDGTYKEYFQLSYESAVKKCKVELKKDIAFNILGKVQVIVLEITAQDKSKNEDKTVLDITLPKTQGPEFNSSFYEVEYPKSGTGSVNIEMEFKYGEDPEKISIALETHEKNFEIKYTTEHEWQLKIKTDLDHHTLQNSTELKIPIIATEKGVINQGYSVLIIHLPESPEFTEQVYTADYPKEGKDLINFNISPKFKDDVKVTAITLQAYSKNFEIVKDKDVWKIKIDERLDPKDIQGKTELITTMFATEEGNPKVGSASLIFKLPNTKDDSPKFKKTYYQLEYPKDSKDGSTLDFSDLEFENVNDASKLTVAVEQSYQNNFRIENHSGKWQFKIDHKLSDETLKNNNDLLIIMTVNDEKSSKAESVLVLKLPKQAGKETLTFKNAFYIANYSKAEKGPLDFDESIEFTNFHDSSKVQVSLNDYSDNFEVTYNETQKKWVLNIKKPLDDQTVENNNDLVLLLKAKSANFETGVTTLVIEIKKDEIVGPKFKNAYYKVEYPQSGTGKIDLNGMEFENVDDASKISVSIDSYKSNFHIEYDSASKKWQMIIDHSLSNEIITKNNELLIAMTVELIGDNSPKDKSVLVLKLPKQAGDETLTFKNGFYIANYSKAEKGPVDFDNSIEFSNLQDSSKVQMSLNDYVDYFEVSYSGDQKKWVLNIKKPLEDQIIENKNDLVLSLSAKLAGFKTGITALVIDIEKDMIVGPKFKKAYYQAEYPESGIGNIELNDIEFENVDDTIKINISIDSYQKNFKIDKNTKTNKWQVEILDPLGNDILTKNSELLITMTVEETGKSTKGTAVLILKLHEKTLTFDNAFYITTYPKSEQKQLDFKDPIGFKNLADIGTAKITLKEYDEYFEAIYIKEPSKWVLKVKKQLDTKTIKSNNELVIHLEATSVGFKAGAATLVIKIDKQISTAPKFNKAFYLANYPEIGEGNIPMDSLDFENVEDTTKINISLDHYDGNFKFERNDSTSKWYIEILSPLSNDILQNNNELRLVMTANVDSLTTEGILILILPKKSGENAPKFSKGFYTVQYPKDAKLDDEINIQEPISFSNADDTEVSITVENYSNNFKITYKDTDKKWVLQIEKLLSPDILQKNKELISTIYANKNGDNSTGKAVLVVQLPNTDAEESPAFSKSLYTGQYHVDTEKKTYVVDLKEKIIVTSEKDSDKIIVTLVKTDEEFDVNQYFTMVNKKSDCTITVTKELDEDILRMKKYLTISVQAELNGKKTTAALIINLPAKDDSQLVSFENILCKGQYKDNKLNLDDIKVITNLADNKVEIKLSESSSSYKDIFKIEYTNKKVNIKLSGTLPSESSTISFILEARVDSKLQSSAVVEIAITDHQQKSIKFEKLIYSGKYLEQNKILTIIDKIAIKTDVEDSKIKIAITDDLDLSQYLETKVVDKILTVTLKEALPSGKVQDINLLSFTIKANIDDSTDSASAVLNVKIAHSSSIVKFDKSIYNGKLNLNAKELSYDSITLTITPSETPELSVATKYQSYFQLTYANESVEIKLGSGHIDVFENLTNIAVELKAKIKDKSASTFAFLNLEIIGDQNETDNLAFSKLLYDGLYTTKDGQPHLEIKEEIEIITNRLEKELKLEVTGDEGKDFFDLKLKNSKILVTLKDKIPDVIVSKVPVITLTLDVLIEENIHHASAILNIRLDNYHPNPNHPDDDLDKTPYIVAISLLAVALVVLVIAAITFYYFRLRSKDYTEVDEELWRVKFDKTSMRKHSDIRKSSGLENRRPTGFVFSPPVTEDETTDGMAPETITDTKDRRKSVIFDDKIEKKVIDTEANKN